VDDKTWCGEEVLAQLERRRCAHHVAQPAFTAALLTDVRQGQRAWLTDGRVIMWALEACVRSARVREPGPSPATGRGLRARPLLGVGFLRVVCPAGVGWAFWVLAGQAISQTFQTLTQALPDVAQPLWTEHEQDDDEYDEPMPDAHCSHIVISVFSS
jgi:hypothetical protein